MLALGSATLYSHADCDTARRNIQFTLARRGGFEVSHFLVPEGRQQIAWGASLVLTHIYIGILSLLASEAAWT